MLETKSYDLRTDVSPSLYSGLVDFALGRCPTAFLIVRDQIDLTAAGQGLLRFLEPYVLARAKTGSWPGTELLGTEAERIDFRLEAGSAQILKSATDHLFGWQQPDLPEDLCLLREDRTPWLVSIAHESVGYFLLTEEGMRQLLEAFPELPITLSGS